MPLLGDALEPCQDSGLNASFSSSAVFAEAARFGGIRGSDFGVVVPREVWRFGFGVLGGGSSDGGGGGSDDGGALSRDEFSAYAKRRRRSWLPVMLSRFLRTRTTLSWSSRLSCWWFTHTRTSPTYIVVVVIEAKNGRNKIRIKKKNGNGNGNGNWKGTVFNDT